MNGIYTCFIHTEKLDEKKQNKKSENTTYEQRVTLIIQFYFKDIISLFVLFCYLIRFLAYFLRLFLFISNFYLIFKSVNFFTLFLKFPVFVCKKIILYSLSFALIGPMLKNMLCPELRTYSQKPWEKNIYILLFVSQCFCLF